MFEVENTMHYALNHIRSNGGKIENHLVTIPVQEPVAPKLEVSFPNSVPFYYSSVFDIRNWTFDGDWQVINAKQTVYPYFPARYAEEKGAVMTFTFIGTGIALKGAFRKDGGKANVYIDGSLHMTIDTYYWWGIEEKGDYVIWHAMNLEPKKHTIRLVVRKDTNPSSTGTLIAVRSAVVYRTGPKNNETVTLSIDR